MTRARFPSVSRQKPGPTNPPIEPLRSGSRLSPGRRIGLALFGAVICLLVAGCASTDSSSEQERRSGFYGGVSGGVTR